MGYERGNDSNRRSAIFEAQGGKCALCGLDLAELARQLFPRSAKTEMRSRALAAHPWARAAYSTSDLFDLDHITPVVNGGGQKGDENLRVLCKQCHKRVTKELAGQRRRLPTKRYQSFQK